MLAAVLLCHLPAATAAPPAGKAASPPDTGRIRFCSYNLKNWLTMDRFDGRKVVAMAPKPDDEKAALINIVAAIHPDILGICEIGGESDLKDLQQRLRAKGLAFEHVETAHGGDATRQLALLSRFPIIGRNSQTDLQYRIGEITLPMQRGILDASIQVNDQFQLRCLGVHLKSKREVPEADQALMRRNEAHLLRRHINAIFAVNPAAAILLYGDFNEHRNEPAIDEIIGPRASETVMNEVKIWDFDGEVWTHFWDAADVYSRFDYFFVSKSLRPRVYFDDSFVYSKRAFYEASDHRPIVIALDSGATAQSPSTASAPAKLEKSEPQLKLPAGVHRPPK